MPELRTHHRRSCICGVHVVPETAGSGDLSRRPDRVDGRCPRRAHGRNDCDRNESGSNVDLYRLFQCICTHRKLIIDRNETHMSVPGDSRPLLYRRVRLR